MTLDAKQIGAVLAQRVKAAIATAVDALSQRIDKAANDLRDFSTRLEQVEKRSMVKGDQGDAGQNATPEQIDEAVANYLAEYPSKALESSVVVYLRDHPVENGKDGADATPEAVAEAVAGYLRENAPQDGKDGADATPEAVAEAVAGYLRENAPQDGKDGADATPEAIAEAVAGYLRENAPEARQPTEAEIDASVLRFFEAHPVVNGKDGENGKAGEDGKSATVEQVRAEVVRHFEANPIVAEPPTDEQVNRSVLDYLAKHPIRDGRDGKDGIDGKNAKDGRDGIGFDDIEVEHDGERNFIIRFVSGDVCKEFPFRLDFPIHRGVYVDEKNYAKSDQVTYDGSVWMARRNTSARPKTSDDWFLSAKRGEGRPGPKGKDGKNGENGRNGKDLTHIGPNGERY